MDGTLQIEHIKKERENGGSFACVTLWCPLFATHGSRPSAFYGYWLHPMGFKVLFLNTKHWHICPERTQGGARMLAGSCVVTLGWSEWQEARRGSDLGKGKQEGHHALGCSSECGHHAWSVQGPPNLCVHVSLMLQKEAARMESQNKEPGHESSYSEPLLYARCFKQQFHRVDIAFPILQIRKLRRSEKH